MARIEEDCCESRERFASGYVLEQKKRKADILDYIGLICVRYNVIGKTLGDPELRSYVAFQDDG